MRHSAFSMFLSITMVTLVGPAVFAQEEAGMTPRSPTFPEITSVEQIMPHARLYV